MIEKLVNIAAENFGFPHYIVRQDTREKLNSVFRSNFGCDAESYYDFYHEPFFRAALIANDREKKCLIISENESALKKVGDKIRSNLDCRVKELIWSKDIDY